MSAVTRERLSELIVWLDRKWKRHMEEEDLEAANELRRLFALEDARWVPWKDGNALPSEGLYVVDTDGADFDITLARPAEFNEYGIHGYWSVAIPLPNYAKALAALGGDK